MKQNKFNNSPILVKGGCTDTRNLSSRTISKDSLPEKYKLQKIDDIIGQPQAVSIIKNLLERGFYGNVLFYGPSGTGKTTAAKMYCMSIL